MCECSASNLQPNPPMTEIAHIVRSLPRQLASMLFEKLLPYSPAAAAHVAEEREKQNERATEKQRRQSTAAAADSTTDAEEERKSAHTSIVHLFTAPTATAVKKVDCPVCGLSIVERMINRHLDECLGTDANQHKHPNAHLAPSAAFAPPPSAAANRLPFPVYTLLSDKQLGRDSFRAAFASLQASASLLSRSLTRSRLNEPPSIHTTT